MAVRFESEIDTIHTDDVYLLQILDSEYLSDPISFHTLGPDGFTINWSSKGNLGRFNPILVSQLTFKISVTDEIRSDVESFVSDMVISGDEERFKLAVYKNGNLYWAGLVIVDRITKSIPFRTMEIRAIDGLGRIQSIEYNNDGVSYTGKDTIRQHLYNGLLKTTTQEIFGASDSFLKTLVTWNEDDLTYSTTENIIDNARLNHLALIKVDTSGNVTYVNTYRAIEEIVKTLGARLFFSDGSWWVFQINEFKSSTRTISNYTKSGSKTLTVTSNKLPFAEWNVTGATDLFMNSGEIEYYAPLRSVILDYNHYSTKNLVQTLDIQGGIGVIDKVYALGETSRLQFTSTITTYSSFTAGSYYGHYQKFRLLIKIGDLYLYRKARIDSNGVIVYSQPYWTSNVEYYELFTPLITTPDPTIPIVFPFEFISPPLLEDGEFSIEFQYVNIFLTDGTTPTVADPPTGFDIADAKIVILTLGTVEGQTNTTRYEVENATGNNSELIEIETIFGDGPDGNSYGAIEVYNGTDWVVSNGWRRKTEGDAVEISQLLINEIISGQSKPVEKIVGTFVGNYEMHWTIKDPSGNHYVFNGGSFRARPCEWNGEWFNIETANTATGTVLDKVDFVDKPNPLDTLPVDATQPVPDIPLRGIRQPNDTPAYFNPSVPNFNIDIVAQTSQDFLTPGTEINFIPIQAAASDGVIKEGDVIQLIDPSTGNLQQFTVARDVLQGDTSIIVETVTINEDGFNPGSVILYGAEELLKTDKEMPGKWYSQTFENVTGNTVELTGTMSEVATHYMVYVNGVLQDIGWSLSGNIITFDWTLTNNSVFVKWLLTYEGTSSSCCNTGSGKAIKFYKQTFENVYTNKVQITEGGGALPTNTANINLFLDGVMQDIGYTVQGNYIVFNNDLKGNAVHVQYFVDDPKVFATTFEAVEGYTITLPTFIAQMATGTNRIMVFVDGIHEDIGWVISGNTLTFDWELTGNSVLIRIFKP